MNNTEQWAILGDALWQIIVWLISFGGQIEAVKEHPIFALFGYIATIGTIITIIKRKI